MKRYGLLLAVLFLLGGLTPRAEAALGENGGYKAGVVTVCHEDDHCWNWRTMGNRKRGVVTIGGRRLVVGPKRFDRLFAQERIDWSKTPILRGDEG